MSTKKDTKWTEELVEELKILYLEKNYSTLNIAKKLGFTKNAVIGKIHRLGLSKNKEDTIEETQEKELDFNYTSVVTNVIKGVGKKAHKGEYTLENIQNNMCVWPYGEDNFTFCGDIVVKGKQYCQEHLDTVYLNVKRVVKKDNVYTEEDDIVEEDSIIE